MSTMNSRSVPPTATNETAFEAHRAPDTRGELRSRTRRHSREFDPFAMSSGNDRFLREAALGVHLIVRPVCRSRPTSLHGHHGRSPDGRRRREAVLRVAAVDVSERQLHAGNRKR